MKIGFSGLGKMGSQMVVRLLRDDHEVIVMNRSPGPAQKAVLEGARLASNPQELVNALDPVIVWLMLPDIIVAEHLKKILPLAPKGSIFIDGGNSDFRNTQVLSKFVHSSGNFLIDVGTSGGILGLENGFSMMVGGDHKAVKQIKPVLNSLAAPQGWDYFGESGSGHYVKMVHNAIEYGMMESYAEGYRMLEEGPFKKLNLPTAGRVWQNGSIIQSLLNQLTVEALTENPNLEGIEGRVAESGEARWTIETAKELGIPLPAIEAAFDVRLKSQIGDVNFSTKLLAAMRNKFGGHSSNPEL
ncbi:NADP-dependent phosphogluconate dehydrogenase [Candidatus Saccharibacteria bacterium]|nr:NADP-dependent phosphogluconate dehydrogenase [Candidatus Saccharibacteria bacterium]